MVDNIHPQGYNEKTDFEDEGLDESIDIEYDETDDGDHISKGNPSPHPEKNGMRTKFEGMVKEELVELAEILIDAGPKNRRIALEWIRDRSRSTNVTAKAGVNDALLAEYWSNVEELIPQLEDINYNGEDVGFEIDDWLEKIDKLIAAGNLSPRSRSGLLENIVTESQLFEYGFDDEIMPIVLKSCKTPEEWQYLVELLEDEGLSSWSTGILATIFKEYLHDDKAYLNLRQKNLKTESDYLDLAGYYKERNEEAKAMAIAEEGLAKLNGINAKLFNFLCDRYEVDHNTTDLQRITNSVISRNNADTSMLDRVFRYYRDLGDYKQARDMFLKAFEKAGYNDNIYNRYQEAKQILREDDWKKEKVSILASCKKKNERDYLRICMDEGKQSLVLDAVLASIKPRNCNGIHDTGCYTESYHDEFANQLAAVFPEQILEYYWTKAMWNVSRGKTRFYPIAKRYLSKTKDLYTSILKQPKEWSTRIATLREANKRRTAFLAEIKGL